ncbi:MAG TPA: IclR family transcriptional regulator [Burkholderiales bacterium]
MAKGGASRYGIRSASLTLGILEQLARSPFQQGITELARALGTSKWRLFRHVHSLREAGYVIQDPRTERFELGTRFYALTRAIPRRFAFADFARPAMVELQREIGHTVVIAALVHDRMVVLDTVAGEGNERLVIAHGKPHDLHASAHGKVALAFGPPGLLDAVTAAPLRRYTAYTITDPDRLRRVVAQVRQRGWASAFEEGPRTGMNTIAAPLFGAGGRFEGSMGFIVPGAARIVRSRLFEGDVEALTAAARKVSARLGYRRRAG